MEPVIFLFILPFCIVLAAYVRSCISPEATHFKHRALINSVPNVYAWGKNKLVFLCKFKQDKLVAIKTLSCTSEYTVIHSVLSLEQTLVSKA